MAKRKSNWSPKEKTMIRRFIKTAKDLGQPERRGMEAAADHFGVTTNAIYCCIKRDYKNKKKVKAKTVSAVEAGNVKVSKKTASVKLAEPKIKQVRYFLVTIPGEIKSVEQSGNMLRITTKN